MAEHQSSEALIRKRPFVRHETPTLDPRASEHWQSLQHQPGDKLLENIEQLKVTFQKDLDNMEESHHGFCLALWSTICGYCEALTTHKDSLRRYRIFPIPYDALKRMVSAEFIPFCKQLQSELQQEDDGGGNKVIPEKQHREAVRLISNRVWKKAETKSKNVRDELHANSVYVCFRGHIDKRSLDCFGSAVVTIAALYCVVEGSHEYSFLTLSEDHAYESHYFSKENDNTSNDNTQPIISPADYGTCEIAIPGHTKEIQQTRGLEVAEALKKASKHRQDAAEVTPETSWLYMRKHPVICHDVFMALAAVIGNINCSINEKNNGSATFMTHPSQQLTSAPLMDLKRDLLWILKERGHLSKFPFALMELGECEEHRSTSRGLRWVDVTDLIGTVEQVTGVEKLYMDAMTISKTLYGDAQAYPYFCAAHYHKDGVWEEIQIDGCHDGENSCKFNPEEEYRLVESMRLYSEATRVASQYRYDLQLMKHTTKAAMLIMQDILLSEQQEQEQAKGQKQQLPRQWHDENNAVAVGTWLVGFYDSLLFWEEACGGKQFCEILTPKHKYSMGKMFPLLTLNVRLQLLEHLYKQKPSAVNENVSNSHTKANTNKNTLGPVVTKGKLLYFSGPRSKRLQRDSTLAKAVGKEKISIGELELTVPMSSEGGRRAKRARR